MRISLTVIALVLDGLCLLLMLTVLLTRHPTSSALLGLVVLGVIVAGNLPALIWSLVDQRRPNATQATAGIFE